MRPRPSRASFALRTDPDDEGTEAARSPPPPRRHRRPSGPTPTTRGLKHRPFSEGFERQRTLRTDPDDEGTEARQAPRRTGAHPRSLRTDPDDEGTEASLRRSNVMTSRCSSLRTDPDDEGTEATGSHVIETPSQEPSGPTPTTRGLKQSL